MSFKLDLKIPADCECCHLGNWQKEGRVYCYPLCAVTYYEVGKRPASCPIQPLKDSADDEDKTSITPKTKNETD